MRIVLVVVLAMCLHPAALASDFVLAGANAFSAMGSGVLRVNVPTQATITDSSLEADGGYAVIALVAPSDPTYVITAIAPGWAPFSLNGLAMTSGEHTLYLLAQPGATVRFALNTSLGGVATAELPEHPGSALRQVPPTGVLAPLPVSNTEKFAVDYDGGQSNIVGFMMLDEVDLWTLDQQEFRLLDVDGWADCRAWTQAGFARHAWSFGLSFAVDAPAPGSAEFRWYHGTNVVRSEVWFWSIPRAPWDSVAPLTSGGFPILPDDVDYEPFCLSPSITQLAEAVHSMQR